MSLDVTLTMTKPVEVFSSNITHNLNQMAEEAGIYKHLWRPDEIGIKYARDLIAPLQVGLDKMKARPEHFKVFNPPNEWGSYDIFVPWLERYLAACIANPDAEVSVDR